MTKICEYEINFTSSSKPEILNKSYLTFSDLELYDSIAYDVDISLAVTVVVDDCDDRFIGDFNNFIHVIVAVAMVVAPFNDFRNCSFGWALPDNLVHIVVTLAVFKLGNNCYFV